MLSPPVVEGLFFGNITLLLLLPLALAWRWRAHAVKAGLAVAVGVAVKPVVLPLLAWLLLTRRFLASAVALIAAAALVLVPWAAIGFDGLRSYPRLLDRLDQRLRAGNRRAAHRALMARLERRRPPRDLPRSGVAAPRARVPPAHEGER